MISAWTKNVKTQEEKEQLQKEVLGSRRVLNRLLELINEEEGNLNRSELSTKVYDVANWPYLQADMNGFRRALNTVRTIITLDQQEK